MDRNQENVFSIFALYEKTFSESIGSVQETGLTILWHGSVCKPSKLGAANCRFDFVSFFIQMCICTFI